MLTPNDDSAVIDALGGSTKVAALCKVRPQAVSAWRREGIPQPRRMYLELLRPDVFEAVAQATAASNDAALNGEAQAA